jgi:hypothetical protein
MLARERAHTHTHKRTHTHHAPGYAMGASAVHTLFSSCAHTIILHDEMRGVRVERQNGYCGVYCQWYSMAFPFILLHIPNAATTT